ncbi:UNVERIFIED_CONTAM: hypothetical protein RMT77_001406 [Armadillidium vulgare]
MSVNDLQNCSTKYEYRLKYTEMKSLNDRVIPSAQGLKRRPRCKIKMLSREQARKLNRYRRKKTFCYIKNSELLKSTMLSEQDLNYHLSKGCSNGAGKILKCSSCECKNILGKGNELTKDYKNLYKNKSFHLSSVNSFRKSLNKQLSSCHPLSSFQNISETELPDLNTLFISEKGQSNSEAICEVKQCSEQARSFEEVNTDELAAYLDDCLHFPKKMSYMAEMMYT